MLKAKLIKGNKLIDFLLEIKGFTLHSGKEQIEDLAVFDLFKWYSVTMQGNELHIIEMDFVESTEELMDHLLIDYK